MPALRGFAQRSAWAQEWIIRLLGGLDPAIEHNLDKIRMLKRALYHARLEQVPGGYFEFGVYEGTSLFAAVTIHRALRDPIARSFYGFDSFDDGFKYFDERDRHPFFAEGDFKSSYAKALRRFRRCPTVHLIKGYFEETLSRPVAAVPDGERCAVAFIDCDLMHPARLALRYLAPRLSPGSVIILDDYWAYRGASDRGTCGAFARVLQEHPAITARPYYSYGHGGMSFVVSSVSG